MYPTNKEKLEWWIYHLKQMVEEVKQQISNIEIAINGMEKIIKEDDTK